MNREPTDKIQQIEEEIRTTPYHKGTEHHIGKLKARLAKLREENFQKEIKKSGGGSGGYAVKKSGQATVVLVGPPSVGKSTLINRLTEANSKVAAYDFTTINVIPGMMNYNGAQIQILDVPGIIEGAASGKGRGKQVLSVIRAADLIIMMVDIKTIAKIPEIKKELALFGIRLGERKPKVSIVKKETGGIKVNSNLRLSNFSTETVQQMAPIFRIRNAEIIIKENITLDQLIDALIGNRGYLPYLTVVNKIDLDKTLVKKDDNDLYISAQNNIGIDKLKESIWQKLNLGRIYLQNHEHPLIIKRSLSLGQILESISIRNKELVKKAKINGPGAKFPGQEVSLSFIPQDETIVCFLS